MLMLLFLPLDGEVWTDAAGSGFCVNYTMYPLSIFHFYAPSQLYTDTLCCIRQHCALSIVKAELSDIAELWESNHFTQLSFLAHRTKKQKKKQGGKPEQNCINISSGVKAIMKLKIFSARKSSQSPSDSLGCWKLLLCSWKYNFKGR